jgi:hypothetical protein
MEPDDVHNDTQESIGVAQARLVLVQQRTVVQVFPAVGGNHVQRTAGTIAVATGLPVSVYAVAARLPSPPAIGSQVDPLARGWVEVAQEQA